MRRELLAQPGHVCLQAVRCGCRRAVTPDVVDQSLVRHDLARTEEQGSEDGPLLAAAQLGCAFLDLGLECSEDAEPEWLTLSRFIDS